MLLPAAKEEEDAAKERDDDYDAHHHTCNSAGGKGGAASTIGDGETWWVDGLQLRRHVDVPYAWRYGEVTSLVVDSQVGFLKKRATKCVLGIVRCLFEWEVVLRVSYVGEDWERDIEIECAVGESDGDSLAAGRLSTKSKCDRWVISD